MCRLYIFQAVQLFLSFQASIASVIPTECEYQVSSSLPTSFQVKEEIGRSGTISKDGTYVTCNHEYSQCMVFWSFDQNDSNITTVMLKGCWKGNGDCERKDCIANEDITSRFINNSRFCCCSSPRCNSNFTYIWMPKNYSRMVVGNGIPSKPVTRSYTTIITVGSIGLAILFVFVIVAVCIFRTWSRNHDRLANEKLLAVTGSRNGTDLEQLLKSSDTSQLQTKRFLDGDQIELLEVISRGRFSVVWKSIYRTTGEYVAVKIYPPGYRQYYINESRIYSWTCMDHENIVRFYGGAERDAPLPLADDPVKSAAIMNQIASLPPHHQQVSPQYWIVTAYMPQGTLQDFLKANTVDWEEMCKIGASVACGLSYLHGMSAYGGGSKPPIVHRDVNSRNVLVKPDGTCALCDFGFALALEEPKGGSSNPQGDTPLTEVGTIRYFAPEILEGAVNLRDPATALKQVDVYALGLVLWEIISRCAPIHRLPGNDSEHVVPDYQPPFAKEISPHPTLEQMQLWVCKKKVRPLFPQAFYKINIGALRVLRILVEDCWDSDSDARITASCAHERLVNLQTLSSVFGGPNSEGSKSHAVGDFVSANARYWTYHEQRRPLQYSAGESTVDTLATGATSGVGSMGLNSSDRARSINSSSLGYHTTAADSPATLQPYQGRNPCMERNLLVESSDDSSNAKDRITESQFQKLDPCSPDTIARFASPALLALATSDHDTTALGEHRSGVQGMNLEMLGPTNDLRLTAAEKSNALALLLMKTEKNRKFRGDTYGNVQQKEENELSKRKDRNADPVEQPVSSGVLQQPMVDFRGSVSGTSNDSGNCTTSGSRSGNNSADGSPRLRSPEGKAEHRISA